MCWCGAAIRGGGQSAERLAKQPLLCPGRACWHRKGFGGAIGVVWVSRPRRAACWGGGQDQSGRRWEGAREGAQGDFDFVTSLPRNS